MRWKVGENELFICRGVKIRRCLCFIGEQVGGSRECTGGWVPAGSNEADERMLNMHVNSDRGRERERVCCHFVVVTDLHKLIKIIGTRNANSLESIRGASTHTHTVPRWTPASEQVNRDGGRMDGESGVFVTHFDFVTQSPSARDRQVIGIVAPVGVD